MLKRTMVYADAEDLAIIKKAAHREGVSEAQIIREAIHQAAFAKREWEEPLNWPSFSSGDPTAIDRARDEIREEQAAEYERSKRTDRR